MPTGAGCHPGRVVTDPAPPRHRWHRLAALVAAAGLLAGATGCAGSPDDTAAAGTVATPTVVTDATGATDAPGTTVPPPSTAPLPPATAPATTAPPVPPSVALSAPCSPDLIGEVPGPVPAPEPLATTLAQRLADPRFAGVTVGASVWVQGLGEVVAVRPDELLVPASGQKLVTAAGALTALDPYATFATRLVATAPVVDGVVDGDLVLVGGDDPGLAVFGSSGLAGLAEQAATTGLRQVAGRLVVVGGLQAGAPIGIVPAGTALLDELAARGVGVAGGVVDGADPGVGYQLGVVWSAPVWQLVQRMLLASDNRVAESLAVTVGRVARGEASTAAGLAVAHAAAAERLCVVLPGTSADGSGLSRDDRHSARSLRQLVQALLPSPWGYQLHAGLPVGGWSGTLRTRFAGTLAEGNVHAKTGTLDGVASLTGYVHTASGRLVVFSVLVNGPGAPAALEAVDELVVALAGDVT